MSEQLFRIKPLVWEEVNECNWSANLPFAESICALFTERGVWVVYALGQYLGEYETADQAKAAAEDDLRSCLMAHLEEVK